MIEVKKIQKKINIYFKKIISSPKEQIRSFNLESYSSVFFISDNASWATDKTTDFIKKYFDKFGLKTFSVFNVPKKQYVFYTNQYSILKRNFNFNDNIIAIDYQHGITKYLKSNYKLLKKIKKIQKKIKIIRVTNSFFKKYLISKGIEKNKILQIPLSVDTNLFKKKLNKKKLRQKYLLPQNKFLIGSFHKDGNGWDRGDTPKLIKGPDILIKTLKNLKKLDIEKNFAVVLTAPARGYVKKKLKALDIKYYHILAKNFESLPDLYNCLDLYLITSRDEGGPTGMFEAMACGVPVVTTDVGHAHDFIKNEISGYKCKSEDFKKLSKYSYKIMKNKKLHKKLSKNSILIAKQNNFKSHLNLWHNFIKKFID